MDQLKDQLSEIIKKLLEKGQSKSIDDCYEHLMQKATEKSRDVYTKLNRCGTVKSIGETTDEFLKEDFLENKVPANVLAALTLDVFSKNKDGLSKEDFIRQCNLLVNKYRYVVPVMEDMAKCRSISFTDLLNNNVNYQKILELAIKFHEDYAQSLYSLIMGKKWEEKIKAYLFWSNKTTGQVIEITLKELSTKPGMDKEKSKKLLNKLKDKNRLRLYSDDKLNEIVENYNLYDDLLTALLKNSIERNDLLRELDRLLQGVKNSLKMDWDELDVEDAVSYAKETMFDGGYSYEAPLPIWLAGVAKNKLRRKNQEKKNRLEQPLDSIPAGQLPTTSFRISTDLDAFLCSWRERFKLILQTYGEVPRQRVQLLLNLRLQEGMGLKERVSISEFKKLLGARGISIKENTIKSDRRRLAQLVKLLNSILDEEDDRNDQEMNVKEGKNRELAALARAFKYDDTQSLSWAILFKMMFNSDLSSEPSRMREQLNTIEKEVTELLSEARKSGLLRNTKNEHDILKNIINDCIECGMKVKETFTAVNNIFFFGAACWYLKQAKSASTHEKAVRVLKPLTEKEKEDLQALFTSLPRSNHLPSEENGCE